MTAIATDPVARPLRRDAVRNQQRVLSAARAALAEHGTDVTMELIALRAGVGVGTVYRRFPDKEALIEALFEDKLKQLIDLAELELAQPDPWEALVGFLRSVAELQSSNRGLQEVLHGSVYMQQGVAAARNLLLPMIGTLLERAQAAGSVRRDVATADIPVILLMLSSLALYTYDTRPDVWQRYLDIILAGLHTQPEQQPFSVPALSDDELLDSMSTWHLKRPS
jgi:AcrR family transcriptional regulator